VYPPLITFHQSVDFHEIQQGDHDVEDELDTVLCNPILKGEVSNF
jgi:hypothetical protein